MTTVTVNDAAEGHSASSAVVDVSEFLEVICCYRCKLCSTVYDSSQAATSHVISAHSQKISAFSTNVTGPASKQTIEQGAVTSLETTASQGSAPLVIPIRNIVPQQSNGTHLIESGEQTNVVDVYSRQNVAVNTLSTALSSENVYHDSMNSFQQSNSLSTAVTCSDDNQSQSFGSRELRVVINGVEVLLSIPDEISLEMASSTKRNQWIGNSVSLASENIQTDIDGAKQLKVYENTVDCKAEGEPKSTSVVSSNTCTLISTTDSVRLSPGIANTMARPNSESGLKEYFVCSKCNMGFVTLDDCKQHMRQQHPEVMNIQQGTDEVTMPPNTVSIGTQAQMYKKPGRKRKIFPAGEIINLDSEGNITQPVISDVTAPIKDEPEDSSAAIKAVNMLGIARVDTDSDGQSKRKVRPPKALVEDYFISRRKHKKRRVPVESFDISCEIKGCTAKFAKLQSLNYHVSCHATEDGQSTGFVCPECETEFAVWKLLRIHLWKAHSIDSDLFKCQAAGDLGLCRYRTDSLQKLEMHQETHSDARPYCCQTCGKGFRQRNQLRNHELTHLDGKQMGISMTGDKNKECHVCKRVFANQKSLKKHVEIVHDRKKPFLCNKCGHESSRKAMLDLHLRTHTGEKPYRCDMCNYMASDHNTLRRHRMRHTGEKPYKCVYCAYSCIQAISLKTHLKNKHPGCEGIYSCDRCQYHTVNKQHWLNHLEDHKNNLINNEDSVSGQNNVNTIHVIVNQESADVNNKNQIVCVDQMGISSANGQFCEPSGSVSVQQPCTVLDLAHQSYLEPAVGQAQCSTVEMVELKDMASLQGQNLDRVYPPNGDGVVDQQIVQLTQTSDGYFIIMNENGQALMQQVEGAFIQGPVGQISSDIFLQQPSALPSDSHAAVSSVEISSGTMYSDAGTLVYSTASNGQMEAGGLHHILTAISAQQQRQQQTQETNLEHDRDRV